MDKMQYLKILSIKIFVLHRIIGCCYAWKEKSSEIVAYFKKANIILFNPVNDTRYNTVYLDIIYHSKIKSIEDSYILSGSINNGEKMKKLE